MCVHTDGRTHAVSADILHALFPLQWFIYMYMPLIIAYIVEICFRAEAQINYAALHVLHKMGEWTVRTVSEATLLLQIQGP